MRRPAGIHRDPRGGFALIEVMMGLMLIALLAALALPGLARGTGQASLRVATFQIAALLRDDRTTAIGTNRPVTTRLGDGMVRSGANGAIVSIPARATLTAPSQITFAPSGRAQGGEIVIASGGSRLIVTVGADAGTIRVVAP